MATLTQRHLTLSTVPLLLAGLTTSNALAAKAELVSYRTDSPITIDGTADAKWQDAKAISVTVDELPYSPANYQGIEETTVSMKSLYDDQFVYFLVQYADPTLSLERYPWQKQADGSWKQLKGKDHTGHDNVYYEDKFGIYWNINAKNFARKGCDAVCHLQDDEGKVNGTDQRGVSPGRKYTLAEGQTVDMWHWKGVRMNPLGLIDDQYVDHNTDQKANKGWGRKGDDKSGGGYVNNVNAEGTGPAFMNRSQDKLNAFTVTPSQKTAFVDSYRTGDLVPGIVSEPFTGSRGDIWAYGDWHEGIWTIEIKRKLVTEGENAHRQDVQFSDLNKSYAFGISVFDNTQINHLYHYGALKFSFDR